MRFALGEFYHVYNRGVEKRDIFLDHNDRERFLRMLYIANATKPVVFRTTKDVAYPLIDRGAQKLAIGAYCLMPNHFHLLVKETTEGGLSAFMEKLMTGYSMYFNKRYTRVGPLFQGRFKAEHVNRDEYLKYLFSYIHLNPVKIVDPSWKETGIAKRDFAKRHLSSYRHSSFLDYTGVLREENDILSRKEFPEYFAQPHEFSDFIDDWLKYQDQENQGQPLVKG